MIPIETADALAEDVLGSLGEIVYEYQTVRGNEAEHAAKLAALDFERRQIGMRGLSWDEEEDARAELRARYLEVQAEDVTRDRKMAVSTGRTYGDEWRSMSPARRAAWIKAGHVHVSFSMTDQLAYRGHDAPQLDGVQILVNYGSDDE
jgi:hypothetical protein